jgi:hypothetical protein
MGEARRKFDRDFRDDTGQYLGGGDTLHSPL